MSENRKYSIGGKTYFQRTLVFGQIRQILTIFKKIEFSGAAKKEFDSINEVIDLLGDNLIEFLAVLLVPEGRIPKTKDNKTIATELEWTIELPVITEVMTDFFILNQASEILKKLTDLMKKMNVKIQLPKSTTS